MRRLADCPHSKTQVGKAGKVLRAGPREAGITEYLDALAVMNEWRACHSYALNAAQMGLRSRIATVGVSASVSQRLKRRWSISQKLKREPNMQLNTIHDIAGCRAVVPDLDALQKLNAQWFRTGRHRVERVYDYVAEPRSTGYRGIHLRVRYDGLPVEVQLRTAAQHAWAVAVEDVSAAHSYDLKNGEGPSEFQDMFVETSGILAEHERTGSVSPDVVAQVSRALGMLKQDSLPLE